MDADQQAYFRALFGELDRAPRQEDHDGASDDELVDYNPRWDDSDDEETDVPVLGL